MADFVNGYINDCLVMVWRESAPSRGCATAVYGSLRRLCASAVVTDCVNKKLETISKCVVVFASMVQLL
jgi:hypothetical protein